MINECYFRVGWEGFYGGCLRKQNMKTYQCPYLLVQTSTEHWTLYSVTPTFCPFLPQPSIHPYIFPFQPVSQTIPSKEKQQGLRYPKGSYIPNIPYSLVLGLVERAVDRRSPSWIEDRGVRLRKLVDETRTHLPDLRFQAGSAASLRYNNKNWGWVWELASRV